MSVEINEKAASGSANNSDKGSLVLLPGEKALTLEGVERLYTALTGKTMPPAERKSVAARLITAQITNGKI